MCRRETAQRQRRNPGNRAVRNDHIHILARLGSITITRMGIMLGRSSADHQAVAISVVMTVTSAEMISSAQGWSARSAGEFAKWSPAPLERGKKRAAFLSDRRPEQLSAKYLDKESVAKDHTTDSQCYQQRSVFRHKSHGQNRTEAKREDCNQRTLSVKSEHHCHSRQV